jgi:hypothetical protein
MAGKVGCAVCGYSTDEDLVGGCSKVNALGNLMK